MRDIQLDTPALSSSIFCKNIADIPEESRLTLKKGVASVLLTDPNYRDWTTDQLLEAARRKGWTMDKITQQFKNADRATIIALVKGARVL